MDHAFTLSVTDRHGRSDVLGVFTTRERAEAYMRHVDAPYRNQQTRLSRQVEPDGRLFRLAGGIIYRIEEWVVDADPVEYLPATAVAPR